MRFSDQIDPGSGALRNWQAQSERLLFDQGSSRRGEPVGASEAESTAHVRASATVFD